jgi:glycosyltransferase 2 family protein
MKRLRSLHWLIWLALPLLLVWLLRSIPFNEIRAVLVTISPLGLTGLIAFNGFAMVFFSSRWWLALRAQGHRLSYWSIFRYRMAAFAISYFTPGTQFGGEPLQVYTVSSRHTVPSAAAVASVTLDKLFELLANFTFLVVGILVILRKQLFVSLSPGAGTMGAAGLLVLPLAYLILLWCGHSPFSRLISRASKRLPDTVKVRLKIQAILDVTRSAEEQIHSLFRQKPATVVWVVGASALIWLLSLAEYWLALRVLGAQLDLWQVVAALTVSRLAFLTPMPGGLGALEAGQMLALGSMGFNPAIGLAISLWIRVRDTSLGLIGLWWGAALIQKTSSRSHQSIHPLPSQAGD